MSKKINQLDAASSLEVNGGLYAVADSTTGLAKKATRAQIKTDIGVTRLQYKATGSEGDTLTIPALAGKDILLILRESGPLYVADSLPMESSEYTWDDTDIVLGAETNPDERFIILYSAY